MQKYAVDVIIKIGGQIETEAESMEDAMRYAESRDADELLGMMDAELEEITVDDVHELKDE